MSGERLKPCPFCGGAPFSRGFRRVECSKCGAEGPGGTKAEAIAAWNRRSPAVGREEIARIVDPSAWQVLDSYIKRAKSPEEGVQMRARWDRHESLATAYAILSLIEGKGHG